MSLYMHNALGVQTFVLRDVKSERRSRAYDRETRGKKKLEDDETKKDERMK